MIPSKEELVAINAAHKALVELKMKLCDNRCDICPLVSHTQGPGICTIYEPKARLHMLIRSYEAKQNKECEKA